MNSNQLRTLRIAADAAVLAFIGYRIYRKVRNHRLEEANKSINDDRLDIMIEDSFPASDPPSYGRGGISLGH